MKSNFLNYIILFFFLLFLNSCQKQNNNAVDFYKIKQEINKLPAYKRIAKWDSLLNLHPDDTLTGYLYFQKGYSYFFMDQNEKAINNFAKALNFFDKKQNKKMTARNYIYLGAAYSSLNEQKLAIKYILKGLNIGTELNDLRIKGRAYRELAHIYYVNETFDKAIDYLNKVIEITKKTGEFSDMIVAYNNLAIIYQDLNRNKKALEYYTKILNLNAEKEMEPYNLMILYSNLGIVTFDIFKDKNKSLKYFHKALDIAQHNNINPAIPYNSIATMYEKLNKLDSAGYFVHKSIKANKIYKKNNYNDLVYLYNRLIQLNLKQNQDTNLLNFLKIRDSINILEQKIISEDNKKTMENNLKLINQQKELNQAVKINNKNKIIFIFIIIMFILGLIISFQFNRFDVLKHKQELVVLEQKILRSQMSPHFIFNVLSSIQNSLLENKPVVSATYLSKFAKLMRQNFDFIQKKHIHLKEELDMIRNYLDTQKFRFKDKFDYVINVDDKLKTEDYLIPPMILQPFVENAIKHGFANIPYKGLITINVLKKDDKICFEIIDNGTGYNPSKKDNKEHALDIFKKRLFFFGKDISESFKIKQLKQGTKIEFCFNLVKA